ncbi:MAG: UDP-N-acetylglucosamine 1-carboxyvinyltransferase [Helicobacter sp.]|nr:UDP-N-acetylglucosamine 1-carboxyvinyltransferase [Helicobacter sp.]
MDFLRISKFDKDTNNLGQIQISGAKNAALPVLASSLLFENELKISNLPSVVDVQTLLKLLENLGVKLLKDGSNLTISAKNVIHTKATYDIVRKMRASILVLGPLLSRFRKCDVSMPGGCAIGVRPVDLHIMAMEQMGAKISIKDGYILARAKNGLKGTTITFPKISVTGTENVIMAAVLAKGKTIVINAAKEPEVVQLCELLKSSGAEISGIGSGELEIYGRDGEPLQNGEVCIIPDRIEAGTYLCAGAILNKKISLSNCNANHLKTVLTKLEEIGFSFEFNNDEIKLKQAKKLEPFFIETAEYPDFPTDLQAQFMALATQCEGKSVITENLFENRFMHVAEFKRLGADIALNGKSAHIIGKTELRGADVMATDLRASFALILGALVSQGNTNIHRIYHLDRGYESIEEKLRQIGIKAKRLKEP